MQLINKAIFAVAASFVMATAFADSNCSIKIINHTNLSFAYSNLSFKELKNIKNLRANIGNLSLSVCDDEHPSKNDEKTKQNCAVNPENTIYTHPEYDATCTAINNWPVYIHYTDPDQECYSKPQTTVNRDVILNFPEDFNCLH